MYKVSPSSSPSSPITSGSATLPRRRDGWHFVSSMGARHTRLAIPQTQASLPYKSNTRCALLYGDSSVRNIPISSRRRCYWFCRLVDEPIVMRADIVALRRPALMITTTPPGCRSRLSYRTTIVSHLLEILLRAGVGRCPQRLSPVAACSDGAEVGARNRTG